MFLEWDSMLVFRKSSHSPGTLEFPVDADLESAKVIFILHINQIEVIVQIDFLAIFLDDTEESLAVVEVDAEDVCGDHELQHTDF